MTDVEIYIKEKGSPTDELSIGYPYEDVAKMDNNQLARGISAFRGYEGVNWEVGLRDGGKDIFKEFTASRETPIESCRWMAVQTMRDVVSEWRYDE